LKGLEKEVATTIGLVWKKRVLGPILVQTALILEKKINQSNLIKKISWACGPAAGPIGPAAAAAAPLRPRPQRSTPQGDGVMRGLDGTMTINASLSFFVLNEVRLCVCGYGYYSCVDE
jgi:hypothetical protein